MDGIKILLNSLILFIIYTAFIVSCLKAVSHVRYYWMDKTVKLKMIHTSLNYGFEYLGNTNRLVITPLTDR